MIIATAGHVDHGKTSLVKALTGVDTDRLPEEKERGLTIDLGFAYHDLGDGTLTGFVDVPGHERFVRTMVAGVSGIDFVLFIVAADDGPMPQTAEHLSILDLLGVRRGVVALTKIDRVPQSRVEVVSEQIVALLAKSGLEQAPILPVSALTSDGVDALRDALCEAARAATPRQTSGNFRLSVDRSFLLEGAGRVLTGTIFSGQVVSGDRLRLAPSGVEVRVRAIHAQSEAAAQAIAGQRCALNIVGPHLRRTAIHRGDWVVAEPVCFPVTRIDARIRVLTSEVRPLHNRTSVHLHHGAVDVTARLATFDGADIAPGDSAIVQLLLDKPISALRGDHVVLRNQSAQRTIGGGEIVDPTPLTRGRTRHAKAAYRAAMCAATLDASLEQALQALPEGVELQRFARAWNLTPADADALWRRFDLVVIDGVEPVGLTPVHWQQLEAHIKTALAAWHERYPGKAGASDEELRQALPERTGKALVASAIDGLLRSGALQRDGGKLRLPQHAPQRSAQEAALWDRLCAMYAASGRNIPAVHDMAEPLGVKFEILSRFLADSARQGHLIKVSDKRYYTPALLRTLADVAEALAGSVADGAFSVATYRDKSGIGRNAAVELLEYFDRAGFTLRIDKVRRIRRPAAELFGAE